jgi:LacI family transcriptional regulator
MMQLSETIRVPRGGWLVHGEISRPMANQMQQPMVTMKDIAREVGLSVTTVSRALNNHGDVSLGTRTLVHEVARRLDYHPNAMARSLQNNRADAIGLLIPPILHRAYDAFWLDFIGGAAASCASYGSDLLLSAVSTSAGANHDFKRLVRGRRVDGLLLCDIQQVDPRIEYLRQHRLPFVAFGRTMGPQDYSFIDVDGAAGARQAVEHLTQLGHRRIAYLGVSTEFSFSSFRLRGYREALARASIGYDESLVHEGLTAPRATAVMARLLNLSDRPTAVFASADFLALAAVKTARSMALDVPEDLSVVVFDDSVLIEQADPPLTAVNQPNRRLGEEAAELLLQRIEHVGVPPVQRLVVPSLTQRLSTAPPRRYETAMALAQ